MTEEEMKSGRFHNARTMLRNEWIEWDSYVAAVARKGLRRIADDSGRADIAGRDQAGKSVDQGPAGQQQRECCGEDGPADTGGA